MLERSASKSAIVCPSTPAAPWLAFTFLKASQRAAKNDANREAFYTKLWIKLLPVQVKLTEQNLDVVFTSYEALRDELRRTGVPIPERLAPPPVTIDAEVKKVK